MPTLNVSAERSTDSLGKALEFHKDLWTFYLINKTEVDSIIWRAVYRYSFGNRLVTSYIEHQEIFDEVLLHMEKNKLLSQYNPAKGSLYWYVSMKAWRYVMRILEKAMNKQPHTALRRRKNYVCDPALPWQDKPVNEKRQHGKRNADTEEKTGQPYEHHRWSINEVRYYSDRVLEPCMNGMPKGLEGCDRIPGSEDVETVALNRCLISKIYKSLDAIDKQIVDHLAQGMKISEMDFATPPQINKRIRKIRERLSKLN